MRISLYTLGCKLNQSEEQNLAEKLATAGYDIVNFGQKADLIIINCCSVTQVATRKTQSKINQAKKITTKVWLTGCYANQNNIIEKIIPDKEKLFLEILKSFPLEKKSKKLKINHHRAFIKIQTGCDNFCSYCIVPYLRGKPVSIKPATIIEQIKIKETAGFKEIVLTGININKYSYQGIDLCQLIKTILKETDIERIRLTSIDPSLVTKKFINLFKNPRLLPHLHLSLQSGCNKILKLMNRQYNLKKYLQIIKQLRKVNKQLAITTDIIVGFPGETEKNFHQTEIFVKKNNFLKIHVFPYSPRQGTAAANLKNQIESQTIIKRAKKLRELSDNLQKSYRKNMVGQNSAVLFESTKNGYWYGYTPNYVKIRYKSKKNISNKIISIKLNKNNLNCIQ